MKRNSARKPIATAVKSSRTQRGSVIAACTRRPGWVSCCGVAVGAMAIAATYANLRAVQRWMRLMPRIMVKETISMTTAIAVAPG